MRKAGWKSFSGVFTCLLFTALSLGQFNPRFQLPPRPPPPDLDLIINYITVTAAKNAAVPRLSSRDFHLFEDDAEQKIDYFAVQDQPATVGIVWGGDRIGLGNWKRFQPQLGVEAVCAHST